MAKISLVAALLTATGLAGVLAGCGGGGTGVASAPPPAPAPSPVPSPAPSPSPSPSPSPTPFTPVAADLFPNASAKAVDTNFGVAFKATYSNTANKSETLAAAQISYDNATGKYLVALPTGESGPLTQQGPAFTENTLGGSGYIPITVNAPTGTYAEGIALPATRYSYVTFLSWYDERGATTGLQEYYGTTVAAQRTAAPLTGNASYKVEAFGHQSGGTDPGVAGTGLMLFDFGSGSVDGRVQLFRTEWGGIGRAYDYELRQGRIARLLGLDSFTASLALTTPVPTAPPAEIASDLQGAFAGPGAAEIFGQFQVPLLIDDVRTWLPFSGVFVGKR